MTNEIKVKNIPINNNENMNYLKNELYLSMKFYGQNEAFILKILALCTCDVTAKKYEELN